MNGVKSLNGRKFESQELFTNCQNHSAEAYLRFMLCIFLDANTRVKSSRLIEMSATISYRIVREIGFI